MKTLEKYQSIFLISSYGRKCIPHNFYLYIRYKLYIIIFVFLLSENLILISDGSDLKQVFYAGGGIRARDLSIMSRTL